MNKPSGESESSAAEKAATARNTASRGMDLLTGSIGDKLLRFALPLAATGVLQQLFNAADIAVVGRFVGKNAMAAVGSSSSFISLLVNSFIGISMGTNVVLARYTGQGLPDRIRRGVHTAILFALISGVCLLFAGEAAVTPLLTLLGVPAEIFPLASLYLRIYCLGIPVILLYNFEAAVFRSQGDTRTPLIWLTVSGGLNVLLNLFFVRVMGMSVEGVAIATIVSNALNASILFFLLLRHRGLIRVHPKEFRIDGGILLDMVKIGFPAGLQNAVFSISNLTIQSAVNSLGADVMAGSAAAVNIEIMTFYLGTSFTQGCSTFVSQNYGAGNRNRCRKTTRIALLQGMIFVQALSFLLLLLGKPLLGFFNKDPDVIATGLLRLRWILSFEFVNSVFDVLSGAMRAYRYSLQPAVMTLLGVCGVRIIWVLTVFRSAPSFRTLVIVYPVSWVITAVMITVLYLILRKKGKFDIACGSV